MRNNIKKTLSLVVVAAALCWLITIPMASAAVGVDSTELRNAVTVINITEHLTWLESNGPRVSGTTEYDGASDYIAQVLSVAGYDVTYQPFSFELWEELSTPTFDQVSPTLTNYPPNDEAGFATMEYSGSGDVTAPIALAANFGCDAIDFGGANFVGNIALIERGVCTFAIKAVNAQNAGAVGAIVFNDEARQDAFFGTLGGPVVNIPVIGTSHAIGQQLAANTDTVVRLFVDARVSTVVTQNILAETLGGREDRTVVVGAHLDSVGGAPGVNDNGSGVAAILEIAKQMAALGIEPRNKVVFAFWGAEESGLFGSQYYVDNLTKRQIKKIALNLNFDMIGSYNYVRFVYDGDGSDTPQAGPNGSGNVETVFMDYFADQSLPVEATAFDGRSDYGPFIDAGIPAGGLFTGADEIKTEEQAAIYGGIAGVDLDPFYHTPDDDLSKLNLNALDEMSDAAAHAILTFAMTTSAVNGTGKASKVAIDKMVYRGPKAQQ